ncbi:hypothetical protein FF1_036819 [Malus domestica]
MLYFLSRNGFVLGLDPYSNDDNCITPPASPTTSTAASAAGGGCGDDGKDAVQSDFLDVCRSSSGSCMRVRQFTLGSRGFVRDVCVWDYVKDDEAAAGIYSWSLIGRVNLYNFDRRSGNKVYLLALDPNDGDILYLELSQHIAMFNCAARTRYCLPFCAPVAADTSSWT